MRIVECMPSSESGIERLTELYTDILAEQAKKQISEQYSSQKQRDEVIRNLIDYVGRKENKRYEN